MKRFILGLLSGLLKTLLLLTAVTASTAIVLGTSNALKKALDESKIYDSFVDTALAEIQKQSHSSDPNEIAIKPEMRQAIQDAFSPAVLKNTAEQIIDGTYHWLDNKVPKPDFNVDLTNAKNALATNLGDYAAKRLPSLSVCTQQQLQEMGGEIDPLNIECRPPGLTDTQIRQEVSKQFANNQQFLGNPVINADTLNKDQEGQSPFEKFKELPKAFSLAKKTGWILGILSLLLAFGLIFLRRDKRAGLKAVGFSLIGTGAFLVFTTLLVTFLFNKANEPGGQLNNVSADNAFQASLISIVHSLTNILNQTLLKFGAGYILLGGIVLIALWFTRTRAVKTSSAEITSDTKPLDVDKDKPDNALKEETKTK